MRITMVTWGTRGEVQPYAALAHELQQRGHATVIAVNQDLVNWTRAMGLSVAPLPFNFRALMTEAGARTWLASGDAGQFLSRLAEREHDARHKIAGAMIEACRGADAIVSGFLMSHRAAAVAQASHAAFVRAFTYPVEPTTAYASPYLGNGVPPFTRDALKLRSHEMARAVFLGNQRADLDELRSRLGLPPLDGTAEEDLARRQVRTIHLFDQRVLPRPHDWPAQATVSGYCFLPRQLRDRLTEEAVAPEVDDWLRAGAPPVYFGFGSTPAMDPARLLLLLDDVCSEIGVRALVCAGWSRFSVQRTDAILVVDTVDLETVLPRCCAAVHHGGAGTTAETLAAGLPTVVCSVFGDQALWGHRVAAMRVGTTLPFQRVDRARLSEALRFGLTLDVSSRARLLGAELRLANGRSDSVDAILDAISART